MFLRANPYTFRVLGPLFSIASFILFSSCDLCLILDCSEPPDPKKFHAQWLGEYYTSYNWYGIKPPGQAYTDVKIEEIDAALWVAIETARIPPGKLLKFRALVTMVADSTLAFNFEDNWGAKGYGTLHKINDGRNQLQLTLRDAPNQTEVSYLYDIYSLLKKQKNHDQFYNHQAEEFYRNNEFKKAIALTNLYLVNHPKNTRALGNLGLFYLKNKQYKAAEESMIKALEIIENKQEKAAIFYNLGLLKETLDQINSAVLYYKASYYLRPNKTVAQKLRKWAPDQRVPDEIQSDHPYNSGDATMLQAKINQQKPLSSKDVLELHFSPEIAPSELETLKQSTQQGFIKHVDYRIERLADDSTAGIKIELFLTQIENHWFVLEIRDSHKCWLNRGDTNWNTIFCK